MGLAVRYASGETRKEASEGGKLNGMVVLVDIVAAAMVFVNWGLGCGVGSRRKRWK